MIGTGNSFEIFVSSPYAILQDTIIRTYISGILLNLDDCNVDLMHIHHKFGSQHVFPSQFFLPRASKNFSNLHNFTILPLFTTS